MEKIENISFLLFLIIFALNSRSCNGQKSEPSSSDNNEDSVFNVVDITIEMTNERNNVIRLEAYRSTINDKIIESERYKEIQPIALGIDWLSNANKNKISFKR